MKDIFNQIFLFAENAHEANVRKQKTTDLLSHSNRVMEICNQYISRSTVLIAAYLHDLLKDTAVNKEELKQFLSNLISENEAIYTCKLIDELTDIYVKRDYPKWSRRKRKMIEQERLQKISAEAQTIKYADIIDSCKDSYYLEPDCAIIFIKECKSLLGKLTKGNPILYKEAVKTVNVRLQLLLWK